MKYSALVRFALTTWLCLVIDGTNGLRTKTDVMSDPESSEFSVDEHGTREAYERRIREPNKHISVRLIRYIRLGGIVQAISEETGIPREELVIGGASQCQDRKSGLGSNVHAAHIIRVGEISNKLWEKDDMTAWALANFIGHTQNVDSAFNFWHGVGGAVDQFQSNKLLELAKIDFKGNMNRDSKAALTALRTAFLNEIDKYVRTKDANNEKWQVLQAEKMEVFNDATVNLMFKSGKLGYDMVKNGDLMKHYLD